MQCVLCSQFYVIDNITILTKENQCHKLSITSALHVPLLVVNCADEPGQTDRQKDRQTDRQTDRQRYI